MKRHSGNKFSKLNILSDLLCILNLGVKSVNSTLAIYSDIKELLELSPTVL